MAGFTSNRTQGLVSLPYSQPKNTYTSSSVAFKPTQGLLPPDAMNKSFNSTVQNAVLPKGVNPLSNVSKAPLLKGQGGINASPVNAQPIQAPSIDTNPYSTENYYKAHPSANPANNSPLDTNPYTAKAPTYPGLVGALASTASQPSEGFTKAQEQYLGAAKGLQELRTDAATQTSNIGRSRTNLAEAGGEQGILQSLVAGKEVALTGEMTASQAAAQAATGQQNVQQQGLGVAAGYSQPQQLGYNMQYTNPLTGQPYGGGQGGNLQSVVQGVVQKLQAGQMTYNDALQALSGYGQGGVNALQQALPQGFNIAQSNTLGGQQGSIGVNYQLADTALKNVESILQSLGAAQTTNIPIINKGANWLSTQFGVGSEQTRAMTGAVQSLRNAYASLLASSKGGTPTDYSGQAQAEIPNEPTPNDIAAIRQNFETLGKARAQILGNPGVTQNNGTTGSNIFSW